MRRELLKQIKQMAKLRSDMIFHCLSYLFNRGLPFIASLIIAKFLSISDFGRYMTVVSLFFSLCLVVDMGFALATVKTVARRAGDMDAVASAVLATLSACGMLGLAMAVAIGFGAGAITHFLLADPSLQAVVIAGALYVPASAVASTATAVLQGVRRYRELAVAGFFGGSVFLTLVTVAALQANLLLTIWMVSVGATARALALLVVVAPLLRRALQAADMVARLKRDLRELWHVALPASLAGLTFSPVNTCIMAMLYRGPNGAVEAGWLGLALQFFSIMLVMPGMLTQFALPKFAALADDHSRGRRRSQLRHFSILATAVCFFMATPIAIGAPFFLAIIAPDFVGGFSALRWMMIAALIAAPQGVFSNYLIAVSHNWTRVFTRLLWAAVVVGCILVFPHLDARGMAIVYAAAWMTILTSQVIVVARIERLR